MGKVNVDEIQVGDLVEYRGKCLGVVTRSNETVLWAIWSDTEVNQMAQHINLTGHWKVINFEEETKVDELNVYTGKEAIEAFLEGKTLEYCKLHYRFTDKLQVDFKEGKGWENSQVLMNNLLEFKMTEVATPQVGDWVKVALPDRTITGCVIDVKEPYMIVDTPKGAYQTDLKHYWEILSPEQIAEYKREQMFSKVGRKLNEYRENDIVFLENTGTICMVTTKSNFNGNVGVKEINKPQKWNASVKQLEPIAFAENLVSLS